MNFMKSFKLNIVVGILFLSGGLFSCDTTEKRLEKTQNAIPTERYEEAKAPDSLSNNKVSGDNDGNDGTMNGSMPEHVASPASPGKDN